MHLWGDECVDWDGIDSAAEFIGKGIRKFGRISVWQYKEKYGTVRVYCSFGWNSLQHIIFPGYVRQVIPAWIDNNFISKIIQMLNPIIVPYQYFIYRLFYKLAVKKWPHLREEILSCADYSELLKGV